MTNPQVSEHSAAALVARTAEASVRTLGAEHDTTLALLGNLGRIQQFRGELERVKRVPTLHELQCGTDTLPHPATIVRCRGPPSPPRSACVRTCN